MAGILKCDQVQSDSNLSFQVAGANVAYMDSTGLQMTDNLAFTGTGNRITGDFSNATVASRVMFQSSTVNGITAVSIIPNGTSTDAIISVNNSSDPTNSSEGRIYVNASNAVRIESAIRGTGTYLPMTFHTNGSERARIDTSGNLLVGTTSGSPGYGNTNTGVQISGSGSMFSRAATDYVMVCNQNTVDGSNYYQMNFRVANVQKGSIISTSSATSYNTSSDYRLKNTIAPMTGALAKVALLKPCTYKWNIDGSSSQGFIAHELAEIVPDCVSGEKDAVDADGNIKPQGIDTSFLVATLTAAIQEQQSLITQLQADVAALKAGA